MEPPDDKTRSPADTEPAVKPSAAYLRMWRRAEAATKAGASRGSQADVLGRVLLLLHQEQGRPGGGDKDIIQRLERMKSTREGLGLGTVSRPTVEELVFLELLEQRVIFETVIDLILWPALKAHKGGMQEAVTTQVRAQLERHWSEIGRKASQASVVSRSKKVGHSDTYIVREWKNLAARNVHERDRASIRGGSAQLDSFP